jgi:ribosomal protein S14
MHTGTADSAGARVPESEPVRRTESLDPMSTNAKEAKHRRQLAAMAKHRDELKKPADQRNPSKLMTGRAKIRVTRRCQICGRARAVYRKFGVCRICFRKLASDGLIPGVRKASW